MRSCLALAVAALAASPAAAQTAPSQSSTWRVTGEAELGLGLSDRGFSLPTITYAAPDGSLRTRRGIVAGRQVAPNTTLGIGLFESLPKARSLGPSDNPMERRQRRSRNAAVGIKIVF